MAARVSDDEAYDAALALVGAGVLSRTPRQVRTARALLTQLDSRQDGCACVCFVLLASRTRHRVIRCCFAAKAHAGGTGAPLGVLGFCARNLV